MVGNSAIGFSVADWWTINFVDPEFNLNFHKLFSSKEQLVTKAIQEADSRILKGFDDEEVGQCAIVASILRRTVASATIDKTCGLVLEFDGGTDILIASDSDIVDWQWSISKTGCDPYSHASELVCLEAGQMSFSD